MLSDIPMLLSMSGGLATAVFLTCTTAKRIFLLWLLRRLCSAVLYLETVEYYYATVSERSICHS